MSESVATDFVAPAPFDIFVPIDDWDKTEGEDGEMRVGGFVTDQKEDRDEQTVIEKGLDFTDFAKYGYLNDNHCKDMVEGAVIGVPDPKTPITWLEKGAASPLNGRKVDRSGWYVLGKLLKSIRRARKVFELGKALQEETEHRRLGFSLQGKILRQSKDKATIMKAMVRQIAITHMPANPRQTAEFIMKSFDDAEEAYQKHIAGEGVEISTRSDDDSPEIDKASTAGSAIAAPSEAAAGDGFAYRTESMEPKAQTADIKADGLETKEKKDDPAQAAANGLVGYDKCLAMTRERLPKLTEDQVVTVAMRLFDHHKRGDE